MKVLDQHSGVPIKLWTEGLPVEEEALNQIYGLSKLPIVAGHIAVMPDVHLGKGCSIGTIVPTEKAVIPAAVGVDLGCGMMAVRTTLTANDLPESLTKIRLIIEKAVPHGRTSGRSRIDRGSWGNPPPSVLKAWSRLEPGFKQITGKYPKLRKSNSLVHLGTLGTGNHFIEICLDESNGVWIMLHSGSRGIGNAIGEFFIEKAKEDMRTHIKNLPDADLAYLREGTLHFDDYIEAVGWAQDFARTNREMMMTHLLKALADSGEVPPFQFGDVAVNCHHNYVQEETHFGRKMLVTRKGAVRAGLGELGIIPGSMGARSYIVKGKGNPQSFESCSHGAGRAMSRGEAKRRFTVADHSKATAGVECRKDAGVIDETPQAYKDIEAVIAAQSDLVEVVHTLKQVVCVKG